ncbi:MAG: serine hydrolase domain-containing protein [Bacteroidota bacterium]
MTKLKTALLFFTALLTWTAFIIYGLTSGFLLRGITTDDSPAAFIAAAEEKLQEAYAGNMAMALLDDGEVVGTAYHSVAEEVTDSTAFLVASLSKWVTAWGVFKLVETGQLDLDAPVDSYLTRWQLPASNFDNDEVTARRLLSHTAGLVDSLGYAGFKPGEPAQTLEASLTAPADASWSDGAARVGIAPGDQFIYSGASYTLLQLLIEEISGQRFQDFMADQILEPLGMHHSTFDRDKAHSGDLAQPYKTDGTLNVYDQFTALAAASLYTTTGDIARFIQANLGSNPVLSEASLDAMYTAHAFIGDTGIHALGPEIFARDGKGTFIHGHDGSGDALNTAARINRETGEGIVVFVTGNYNYASRMADYWIHWTTGIADFVVIMSNKNWLLTLLLAGYGVILVGGIVLARRKK